MGQVHSGVPLLATNSAVRCSASSLKARRGSAGTRPTRLRHPPVVQPAAGEYDSLVLPRRRPHAGTAERGIGRDGGRGSCAVGSTMPCAAVGVRARFCGDAADQRDSDPLVALEHLPLALSSGNASTMTAPISSRAGIRQQWLHRQAHPVRGVALCTTRRTVRTPEADLGEPPTATRPFLPQRQPCISRPAESAPGGVTAGAVRGRCCSRSRAVRRRVIPLAARPAPAPGQKSVMPVNGRLPGWPPPAFSPRTPAYC